MKPCCPFSGVQHHQSQHGVKRIGSHSWENDSFKGSKHLHVEAEQTKQTTLPLPFPPPPPPSSSLAPAPSVGGILAPASPLNPSTALGTPALGTPALGTPALGLGMPTINGAVNPLFQNSNLWQPFSVTVSPLTSAQFAVAHR